MANQIRFKRASGSDPSASDLALGEPAVRTDTAELFFKKDDGTVAKVSGGGGIDDGDKGDITVSNSGATFTIDNDVVTFAKMQNIGTPSFLGRNSSSTGNVENLSVSDVRTMLNVENGATADQSASEIKSSYESNSNTNAFTDALLSKLNGIAASATNVTNTNQLTNGAGFITATLTNEQVQDIVGGMVSGNTESGISVTYQDGDGTLDFVVSSQTDNNFTNTLLNKLNGIAAGATNVTNTNQLTNGAGFITATLTNEQVQDIVGGMVTGNTESGITVTYQDGDGTLDFSVASQTDQNFTTALKNKLDGIAASATNVTNNNQLTNGAGYITSADGGNAATLDGIDSSSFVRSDAADTLSGTYTFSADSTDVINFSANSTGDNRGISFNGRTALSADYNDGYLRLNNANEFSNGVYTPLVMRADGGFNVDGTMSIDGSGNIVASKVPTLNQNTTGSSGSCTGNAATATRLQTARTIAGTSFNGTANINISYNNLTNKPTIPTNNNQLSNGAGYLTSSSTLSSSRLSGSLPAIDGSNLTNISATVAGGAIYENAQTISSNYTITNGKNAMSAGPITINSGVTVTVGSGETYTIV